MKKLLSISCVLVLITALLCGCIAEELPEEESRPETTTTMALTTFSTAPTTTITQTTAETTSMTTQDTTTGVTAVPSTTVVTTVVTVTVTQTGTATQTQPGQTTATSARKGAGFTRSPGSRGPAIGTVDGFYAELWFESEVHLIEYKDAKSEVYVPTELSGCAVTQLSLWAFVDNPHVDIVHLPTFTDEDARKMRVEADGFPVQPGRHWPSTWYVPQNADLWKRTGGYSLKWQAEYFWYPWGDAEQHVYVPKTLAFDCSYMEEHSLLLEKTEQGDTVTYHMNGDEEYGIQPTTFTVHYYE